MLKEPHEIGEWNERDRRLHRVQFRVDTFFTDGGLLARMLHEAVQKGDSSGKWGPAGYIGLTAFSGQVLASSSIILIVELWEFRGLICVNPVTSVDMSSLWSALGEPWAPKSWRDLPPLL